MLAVGHEKPAVPLRVVVIDDHPLVRVGVKKTLESGRGIHVLAEAGDGKDALAFVQRHGPDVVVLDLLLPYVNGVEIIRSLLQELPTLKIVVYSSREDPWCVQDAMSAGATGYVFKRSPASELLFAVQQVASGKCYLDRSLSSSATPVRRPPRASAHHSGLSKREAEVLRLVALGTPIKAAAGAMKLSPRTFETYKARAMQKLQLRSRVDLMRFAAQCGWLR